MTDWSKIVSGDELLSAGRMRSKTYKKENNQKVDKSQSELFEDRIWKIFYKMGFTHLNKDRSFKIDLDGNSKQIDILAMDDKTCVMIECKSTSTVGNTQSFKQELESIHGYFADACKKVEEEFGPRKFKFIFATENYLIMDESADMQRMNSYGIYYINDDAIAYYEDLVNHLGKSARFQLLGNLFKREVIEGLNCSVPAIKGVMADATYYSFLIEPEKLLQIAYVLHRNEANHLLMPTYQRLIKKDRLKSITQFIDEGNYFPNSLVVSIDSDDAEHIFTPLSDGDTNAQSGILHLPQQYRSVYVIDGQHRLYGYSQSPYAETHVVPVVAFVNLSPEKQVSMFMQINENQKSVSKTLRNTLNIDLLWASSNPTLRKNALMLKVAEGLGDSKTSPLYGRVITGENKQTTMRCITTEYVKNALNDSRFLNQYNKAGEITSYGSIDKSDNDKTYKVLVDFLNKCFSSVRLLCEEEWNKGGEGFLSINNSAYALIRIFDDISHIVLTKRGNQFIDNTIAEELDTWIIELCQAINKMSFNTQKKIKTAKGGGAKKEAWRTYQIALNAQNPEFTFPDLQAHIEEHCVDHNGESEVLLKEIEAEIISRFQNAFANIPDWFTTLLPEKLYTDIASEQAKVNIIMKAKGEEEYDRWHFISFEEIVRIINHSNNWTAFASQLLARPQIKTKTDTVIWLRNLEQSKSKIQKGGHIPTSEFKMISDIHNDFCTK